MTKRGGIFLGFDPGGKGRFGWSICTVDAGQFKQDRSGTVWCATDAVKEVNCNLPPNARVLGAGIDAPMFWDKAGNPWRKADKIIKRYGGGSPVSLNGLRGSVVVQGILLAVLLRERFAKLPITEVFPSGLRNLLQDCPPELERCKGEAEDERDARTAAYAAWFMYKKDPRWRDIRLCEPNPYCPVEPPVGYWMPIK